MWARYDLMFRRLKHWSTVAFTSPPESGEADVILPPNTVLPGPITQCRLTEDLVGLEIDPTLVPPPRARCLDFARSVHLYLDGADATAKFDRGLYLRSKSPALVPVFVNDLRLAGNRASRGALAAARSSWSAVKGDSVVGTSGSDPSHLSLSEANRIEAAAVTTFAFALV